MKTYFTIQQRPAYFTIQERTDGFGAQFQTILFTLFYCEKNNSEFIYNQIKSMEHNYDNDSEFINKVDDLMNIKYNYKSLESIQNKSHVHVFGLNIIGIIQQNINFYINDLTTKKYKEIFWMNKNKNFFQNNKLNVSVHIRRPNIHDNRIEGTTTPDEYYIKIMNSIRKKYYNKNLQFHIYSQGNKDNFKRFENTDTVLHIDEDLFSTFTGLVAADILVTSASSFSYSAAFISSGEIYYLPFWHPPLKHWIVCNNSM